jgi:2-polyprenyl-6-hydroxyphenyl methylase/3-demethylubiquinone-9 3-methyltransferase
VLELGCGYGRVLRGLARSAVALTGVDTSVPSLALAKADLSDLRAVHLLAMDAARLGFQGMTFDLTLCIQNGISAFGVDRVQLLREAIRVTRPGGRVLFSSYAAGFWEERLGWFRLQALHGLIGEIDEAATGNGVIVCKDGFRASTVGPDEFALLARSLDVEARIEEVGGSSLFCEIIVT